MSEYFERPTFSPGVPQRELRSSYSLIRHAGEAGIIPPSEWQVLSSEETRNIYEKDKSQLFSHLEKKLPNIEDRRGSDFGVKIHYSKELWQKAKRINRGRSVLACTFAHLKAMRTLVDGNFDFILEDNVRAPINRSVTWGEHDDNNSSDNSVVECARRIHEVIEASMDCQEATGVPCHLRYYGWLGSLPNLQFVIHQHCPKTMYIRKKLRSDISIFPFPITSDFDRSNELFSDQSTPVKEKQMQTGAHDKAGGTPIWGAYAYWISKEGYQKLLASLQKDVGALLWKGKRMRCHLVKPIDKVLPRKIIAEFKEGRDCIHVGTHAAFFRAPMLTSQIHSKWDPEFCKSTEYQMSQMDKTTDNEGVNNEDSSLAWDNVWLSTDERKIVQHKKNNGVWLTMKELESMSERQVLQNDETVIN